MLAGIFELGLSNFKVKANRRDDRPFLIAEVIISFVNTGGTPGFQSSPGLTY